MTRIPGGCRRLRSAMHGSCERGMADGSVMLGACGESSARRLSISSSASLEYWIARSSRAMTIGDCHCEERSDEAIQLYRAAKMDCFASLAMTGPQTQLRIPATWIARVVTEISAPLKSEGAGKAGCWLAPAVSCAICARKCAHEHTGSSRGIRPSLRNGLTAYAALSPATNSSCHRHQRIDSFANPVGLATPPPT